MDPTLYECVSDGSAATFIYIFFSAITNSGSSGLDDLLGIGAPSSPSDVSTQNVSFTGVPRNAGNICLSFVVLCIFYAYPLNSFLG